MTRHGVSSTYRLQLRSDAFTLADAGRVADYLNRLGVTHVYLSPVLTATRGSTHGYDVTDPTTVSADLGGPRQLQTLADELHSRGMGLVIDIVPNHAGVGDPTQNSWWWDVLEFGRRSAFADYFDIDWRHENGAGGRIALPVLGEANDIAALSIDRSGPKPLLTLGDLRFPVAPGTDTGNPIAVHDRQAYRLVNWRHNINTYRRFFTVDTLAALRQEDERVFTATHTHVAQWAAYGLIDGIRVDHPDGLSDPATYLARLREIIGPARWLVVEKILAAGEPLDPTLPIDGTTGYDALAELNSVFVDPTGERVLTELATELTGSPGDAAALHTAERELELAVLTSGLAPDVARLVAAIQRESGGSGDTDAITRATVEVIAAIPVYRCDYPVLAGMLERVVAEIEAANPELAEPLSLVVAALSRDGEAAVRLQQISGAATAKAVEDCLFYRTARLVSLQEVGGDPGAFALSANAFHLANTERAHRWPRTMTTLSTHDTKRGEDVRARIAVLSQVAPVWRTKVSEWNRQLPSPAGSIGAFLWQNIFGVWPVTDVPVGRIRDRLHAYAEKAMRESGEHTSWSTIEQSYEQSVHAWIDAVLDGPVADSIGELAAELAPHGWAIALGQKLLQLCGPGIPDVYQGTELWDDSLVDPDNRRLVDFTLRRSMLDSLARVTEVDETGAAKMWVVAHSLWLRRERPESFVGGTYAPILASGSAAGHVLGFARGKPGAAADVIALTVRHTVAVAESGWGDTVVTLPAGVWLDRLSGSQFDGSVAVAALFDALPVALLVRAVAP